jgi:hypothetical protein
MSDHHHWLAEILRKAQGRTDAETGQAIDVGYEVMNIRTEIERLQEDLKGPDGFATWKDAAIAERVQRVAKQAGVERLKQERNEIIEQCAMVCDARQAEHRNNYRGRIGDQTKIAETKSCASAIRALKEER